MVCMVIWYKDMRIWLMIWALHWRYDMMITPAQKIIELLHGCLDDLTHWEGNVHALRNPLKSYDVSCFEISKRQIMCWSDNDVFHLCVYFSEPWFASYKYKYKYKSQMKIQILKKKKKQYSYRDLISAESTPPVLAFSLRDWIWTRAPALLYNNVFIVITFFLLSLICLKGRTLPCAGRAPHIWWLPW